MSATDVPAMIPDMACPFCGGELRRGWVRARGIVLAGIWAPELSVNFEVMDGSGEGSVLLSPGWLGRRKRRARCCVSCEAVIVDPAGPDAVDELTAADLEPRGSR